MSAPNRNFLWAQVVIDELARSGLRNVCIAPGSRSTPLTVTFAEHPDITVHRHLDERSAAFYALGLARATNTPVALVCTSGSAVGNFFPAIIEAHESRLPLLVLTGDRPPELRYSGANQTIDQVKIYGEYALWSVDLALPEGDPEPLTVRYLRTTAARAFATANGVPRGVVHLNFPFRKPLEPIPVAADRTEIALPISDDGAALRRPFTSMLRGTLTPGAEQIEALAGIIHGHEHGLIVCGTNCASGDFPRAVSELSRRTQYPLFAEPSSGARFGAHVSPLIIGGYETFLSAVGCPAPDVVIRFGDAPTSKWLNEYLDASHPRAYVQVSTDGIWTDDLHHSSHFVQCDPVLLCDALTTQLPQRPSTEWSESLAKLEAETWSLMGNALEEAHFDGAFVHDLVASLPPGAHLFTGSSLPVRHVDQFGQPRQSALHVYANRGASGIDGNVSTALGIAAAHPDEPVILLVGDITLYHDMNGLFAVRDRHMDNVTIVLMNNDGGGIFQRLPISKFDPPFADLFVMSHGLDFSRAAALYDLDYERIDNREALRKRLAQVQVGQKACLIEVPTHIKDDEAARIKLVKTLRSQLEMITITTA